MQISSGYGTMAVRVDLDLTVVSFVHLAILYCRDRKSMPMAGTGRL